VAADFGWQNGKTGGERVMEHRRHRRSAGFVIITSLAILHPQPTLSFSSKTGQINASEEAVEPLPKAYLDGHYFARDGKRFLPVGATTAPGYTLG
jgi:hypothetical protein